MPVVVYPNLTKKGLSNVAQQRMLPFANVIKLGYKKVTLLSVNERSHSCQIDIFLVLALRYSIIRSARQDALHRDGITL